MSYILDALRRAERERERGGVPGLHAQPLGGAAPATTHPGARRTGLLAALLLALVLATGLGWWLAPRAVNPTPVAVGPAAPPSPVVAGAALPSAPVPTPPVAAAPARAATNSLTTTAPAAGLNPAVKPAPGTAATANAGTRRAPTAQAAEPLQPAPATAPTTAPTGRTLAYEQLPADVKRQLPNLNLGGAIYSDTPSARMLLVNGQLLHEGDAAAPGVVLETIRQRSAVLRWRELRYEVQW